MSLSTAEKLILFSERPFSLQDFFLRNPVDGFIYEGQDVSLAANYVAGGRSDLIVQWAESTGVTPITVTETACGLRLDERFTGIRGPELCTNGEFGSGTTGWAGNSATVAAVSGELEVTNTAAAIGRANFTVTTVIGSTYEIIVARARRGTSTSIFLGWGTAVNAAVDSTSSTSTTNVPLRLIVKATATTQYVQCGLNNVSGATGYFDGITIREIPGNHTLQATSAARPVVSQRVSEVTKSDQINDAVWAKTAVTVTANSDGSGDKLVPTGAGDHYVQQPLSLFGYSKQIVVRAKADGYNWLRLQLGANAANFNVSTGAIGTAWGLTASIVAVADMPGYYDCTAYGTAANGNCILYPCSADNTFNFTGDGTSGVLVARVDVRSSDDAAKSIPAYQYVNTATDYDTVGFPAYERFDGVDDNRTCASGGGSTTGFFWCGVVTVLGGAGANRTLFDDRGTNAGVILRISTSNSLSLILGNGTTFAGVFTANDTTVVGSTYVLAAWYEGGVGYVQINNQTPVASAAITLSAGVAGFTEGKSHTAASEYHNGRLYGRVMTKNYCPSASQRELIKRELARQACATHLLT